MTVASKTLSQYEIERNKPIPNRIHTVLQMSLGFLLQLKYGKKYQFASEVSLATNPGTTPDISIFPKRN